MVDWTVVIVGIIAAIPPTLAAVAALVVSLKTHKEVNSRMTQMQRLISAESYARGKEDQRIADQ